MHGLACMDFTLISKGLTFQYNKTYVFQLPSSL